MSEDDKKQGEEKDKKEQKKRGKGRKIALAAVAIASGLSAAGVVGGAALYNSFFKRYERPDYSVTPGIVCYERVKSDYPREEIFFRSEGVRLKGYYYTVEGAKGLVIVVHGLHAGSDDMLPIITYMLRRGYNVFSYDGTGTYDSEGDGTVGMCRSLVDLDNALSFLQREPRFAAQPLFLVGHSCGGYAVTSVLSIKKGIKAVAAYAAVADCYTLIADKGRQYAGDLAGEGLPRVFLDEYQKLLFGSYVNYNGVTGVNSTNIPVLIAHGTDDNVISYCLQSLISHKSEIINPNVEFMTTEGLTGGHSSILFSERAVLYKRSVDKEIADIKKRYGEKEGYEKVRRFVSTVDHSLYSEVNYDLLDKTAKMFDNIIQGG